MSGHADVALPLVERYVPHVSAEDRLRGIAVVLARMQATGTDADGVGQGVPATTPACLGQAVSRGARVLASDPTDSRRRARLTIVYGAYLHGALNSLRDGQDDGEVLSLAAPAATRVLDEGTSGSNIARSLEALGAAVICVGGFSELTRADEASRCLAEALGLAVGTAATLDPDLTGTK
jgi:hypothetical protein